MNQVTEEQKSAGTKTLAIVGFIAAVIFIVWLVVQIVGVLPSAFSSLASIADSVYNYNDEPTLNVSTSNSVVNSNDSFVISWEKPRQEGTFTFEYQCEEGVSMSIRNNGTIETISCDTTYDVGQNTSLDAIVTTQRYRFTDVNYSVTHVPKKESAENIIETRKITVVNVSIPTSAQLANDEGSEFVDDTVNETESEKVVDPTPITPTPQPQEPIYVEEVVYALPVSDPNGYTDLEVTYLAVGVIKNGRFVKAGQIDVDQKGAFKFMVKNIGTKTSNNWSFNAELPSDISYNAPTQLALKPNEQSVYTLGFDGIARTGVESFGVTLDVDGDVNSKNNDFNWAVTIVD